MRGSHPNQLPLYVKNKLYKDNELYIIMLFKTGWRIAWYILVFGSIISLFDVSKDTCGYHIPILLSRALTTDPYRGATLVFCLVSAVSSIYLNSLLLVIGFCGFLCAFLVSMFETASSHDALILISALLVMYECRPGTSEWRPNALIWWKIHWWGTVIAGCICTGWFIYIIYGCDPEPYESGTLPESVRCARCSWWFISEYVCFWSMFMLVYWKIDPLLEWHDNITPSRAIKESEVIQEPAGTRLLVF